MHDDDVMDRLLRDAMATEVPRISPGFDTRLMRRIRPRRLTAVRRLVLVLYVVLAAAAAAWFMRDLDARAILAALLLSLSVAGGTMAYARRLASALDG
jgi:hypothetical protein